MSIIQQSPPPLNVNFEQCIVEFKAKPNHDNQCALTHIALSITYPGYNDEIAYITGHQIHRDRCPGQFLEVLGERSQELYNLGATLFDENGSLKPEHVDNEYHKGTGIWGREFNRGSLLYIGAVMVKEPFRKIGLGSWMLTRLMQSECVDPSGLVICWPTPITRIEDAVERDAQRDIAVSFFCKNGFRRIGRTSFFAFTSDTTHPSHMLAVSDDASNYPQPVRERPNVTGETDEEYVERRKSGCTCGQCAEGWICPRMRYRLLAEAQESSNQMLMHPPRFIPREPLHPSRNTCYTLDFIPLPLWQGVYISFYRAYRLVILAIAHVLKQPGTAGIPRGGAVLDALREGAVEFYADHWSQDRTQFFFAKGGRVVYALDYLTWWAREMSALGGGQFEGEREGDETWRSLCECANDLDFALVREKLELVSSETWGPYLVFPEVDIYDRKDSFDEDGNTRE